MLAIVNPAAGGGRCGKRAGAVLERLRRAGMEIEVVATRQPGEATELARTAFARGCRRFLAVGGDGTAFEVVNGIAGGGERAVLGFLPLGTGNSFLRDFTRGDPAEHALACLRSGQSRACDLLRLEHAGGVTYSLNLVCLGFPADVAKLTNQRFKRLGAAGYLLGVLACLVRLERREFELVVDGEEGGGRGLMVVFANSRFTGGKMLIAPRADACDGAMELVFLGPIGRLALLRRLRGLFDGSSLERPPCTRRTARRVEFGPMETTGVMIDGEVLDLRCRALEVVPGALEVLA